MPFHYYHHERMRVCLVHTTCLTLVPCVPRTCPDVEPVHGTTTMPVNMPRRRRWPACGSTVPLSSAAMLLRPTTGLRYRIDNEHHFSMEPRNHTLEPAFLSPCLRTTCSGTKWNQMEPAHQPAACKMLLPYSLLLGHMWLITTTRSRTKVRVVVSETTTAR